MDNRVRSNKLYMCICRNDEIMHETNFKEFYNKLGQMLNLRKEHTAYFFKKRIPNPGDSVFIEYNNKKIRVKRIY